MSDQTKQNLALTNISLALRTGVADVPSDVLEVDYNTVSSK